MPRNRLRLFAALILAALIAAALLFARPFLAGVKSGNPSADAPIGLFTSLPILWSESADLSTSLGPDARQHWALAAVARHGQVQGLDLLSAERLSQFRRLVLAQPRPLTPQENVALDDWVRGGGQLLLLADPALTEESIYPIGDARRPQDVVLLSPILTRWGLDLRIDGEQPLADSAAVLDGIEVPLRLPGFFVLRPGASCQSWGRGELVRCTVGKGAVTALADAAVAEADDSDGKRSKAFSALLDKAFTAP